MDWLKETLKLRRKSCYLCYMLAWSLQIQKEKLRNNKQLKGLFLHLTALPPFKISCDLASVIILIESALPLSSPLSSTCHPPVIHLSTPLKKSSSWTLENNSRPWLLPALSSNNSWNRPVRFLQNCGVIYLEGALRVVCTRVSHSGDTSLSFQIRKVL